MIHSANIFGVVLNIFGAVKYFWRGSKRSTVIHKNLHLAIPHSFCVLWASKV